MQKIVNDLLSKEMSRKEFLSTVGVGLISVLGFSSLVKMLGNSKSYKQQTSGYGSTSYGNKH